MLPTAAGYNGYGELGRPKWGHRRGHQRCSGRPDASRRSPLASTARARSAIGTPSTAGVATTQANSATAGDAEGSDVPVAVATSGVLSGVTLTQAAAGDGYACAREIRVVLSTAGATTIYGELGDGSTTGRILPLPVLAGTRPLHLPMSWSRPATPEPRCPGPRHPWEAQRDRIHRHRRARERDMHHHQCHGLHDHRADQRNHVYRDRGRPHHCR